MNSTPSDEVTWENSTWNEHQLGLIHIIRILANHNRRNSSKFNEILRSIEGNKTTHFDRNYFLADSECPHRRTSKRNFGSPKQIRESRI